MKQLLILSGLLLPLMLSAAEFPLTRLAISDGNNNRDLTISPDGSLLLTSVTAPRNQHAAILIAKRVEGDWGELAVAPFSGRYPDIEPMFDPAGTQLYFASKRPHSANDGSHWDLWSVPLSSDGRFGEPRPLPAPINTPDNEFYPSVTLVGDIYFTSEREGSLGREDIFVATAGPDGWQIANVGAGVNSEHWEFNSYVSAQGDYLLFTSQGREDDLGRGDLYISYRLESGEFGPARHLGDQINSDRLDYCPFVHGNWLYFSSERLEAFNLDLTLSVDELRARLHGPGNGLGDLYRVSWSAVPKD